MRTKGSWIFYGVLEISSKKRNDTRRTGWHDQASGIRLRRFFSAPMSRHALLRDEYEDGEVKAGKGEDRALSRRQMTAFIISICFQPRRCSSGPWQMDVASAWALSVGEMVPGLPFLVQRHVEQAKMAALSIRASSTEIHVTLNASPVYANFKWTTMTASEECRPL